MSHYILSIGGSGHRALEPLVFLAAAGALGNGEFQLLTVDNDATNGNLKRTLSLIDLYDRLRGAHPWLGDTGIFLPKLSLIDSKPWSPFPPNETQPTLDSYFRHAAMSPVRRDATAIYEFLYDANKRAMVVNEGFRGRPSIGAAVYRSSARMTKDADALESLRQRMVADTGGGQKVRLFAMGSIFGGTGAAGLPTLPGTLIEGMSQGGDSVLCGGAFLLPYFKFNSEDLKAQGLHANPEEFVLMMKDALEYYQRNPGPYRRLYAIGADQWRLQPKASVGKDDQTNPANLVEFLAACAASNFFISWTPAQAEIKDIPRKLVVCHRKSGARFEWADLPEHDRIRPKLAHFTRFCFLYLSQCHELLRGAAANPELRKSKWYRDLIEGAGVAPGSNEAQVQLRALGEFCQAFLMWWREIQQDGGVRAELADVTAFPAGRFIEERFGQLNYEPQGSGKSPIQAMRELASVNYENIPNVSGLGHFVRGLFQVCQ